MTRMGGLGQILGLRALEVSEERELAGRVAGLLYLIGAATISLLLLLPGTETAHWPVVLAIAGLGVGWGLCCLLVIDWQRARPWVSHLSSAMGLPVTAVAMAATGGAGSPARFYLFFIVVYCSYFYPAREALPHLFGCAIVLILPLAYDEQAIDGGLLGETLVLVPTFFILGGLIMEGKRIMLELSRRDVLTGLVNRRVFEQCLDDAVDRRRKTDGFALVICDLDAFKDVNTAHGYQEGDRVLCMAGEALATTVREQDLVARLGGDEFAIVVRGVDASALNILVPRLGEALLEVSDQLDLPDYRLTASFGWALFPDDAQTAQDLFAKADAALRLAKQSGLQRKLAVAAH